MPPMPPRSPLSSSLSMAAFLLALLGTFRLLPAFYELTASWVIDAGLNYTSNREHMATIMLVWTGVLGLLLFSFLRGGLNLLFSIGLMRLVEWLLALRR